MREHGAVKKSDYAKAIKTIVPRLVVTDDAMQVRIQRATPKFEGTKGRQNRGDYNKSTDEDVVVAKARAGSVKRGHFDGLFNDHDIPLKTDTFVRRFQDWAAKVKEIPEGKNREDVVNWMKVLRIGARKGFKSHI